MKKWHPWCNWLTLETSTLWLRVQIPVGAPHKRNESMSLTKDEKIEILERTTNQGFWNLRYAEEYSKYCYGIYSEEDFTEIATKFAQPADTLDNYSDGKIKEIIKYLNQICQTTVTFHDIVTLFNLGNPKDITRLTNLISEEKMEG